MSARSGWLVCLCWLSFVDSGWTWSKTLLVLGCAWVVFCEFCVDLVKEMVEFCIGLVCHLAIVGAVCVPDLVGWCACFGCLLLFLVGLCQRHGWCSGVLGLSFVSSVWIW